jgi:hypothetical protein
LSASTSVFASLIAFDAASAESMEVCAQSSRPGINDLTIGIANSAKAAASALTLLAKNSAVGSAKKETKLFIGFNTFSNSTPNLATELDCSSTAAAVLAYF